MRPLVEITDDLRNVYIAARKLGERAEALKAEADKLRDVAYAQAGRDSEAFTDACGLHHHADWASSAFGQARDLTHAAFDVAAESAALRKLDLR